MGPKLGKIRRKPIDERADQLLDLDPLWQTENDAPHKMCSAHAKQKPHEQPCQKEASNQAQKTKKGSTFKMS